MMNELNKELLETITQQFKKKNAKDKNFDVAEELIKKGAHPNEILIDAHYFKENDFILHFTEAQLPVPLTHVAVHLYENKALDFLLKHGADVNSRDGAGATLTHNVVWRGSSTDLMKIVLKYDPDLTLTDHAGIPILHYCDQFQIKQGCLKLLQAKGVDLLVKDKEGKTLVDKSAPDVQDDGTFKFLVDHIDPTYTDQHGNSLILLTNGYEKLLKFLVEKGVDLNHQNDEGNTILHKSVYGGDKYIYPAFKKLLKFGADPTIKNKKGQTFTEYEDEHGNTILMNVTHLPWIKQLIKEFGADINKQNSNGSTLLHKISYKKDTELLEGALKLGADPNIQNNAGQTSLHLFAKRKNSNAIEILLKNGAQPTVKDHEGRTYENVLNRAMA